MARIIKIGIVGCGVIGTAIARYCDEELADRITISALFDIDTKKAHALKEALSEDAAIAESLDELIGMCELIVEAASCEAASAVLKGVVEARRDAVIMSSGGILGEAEQLSRAEDEGIRVYVPSGAVAGLDGIKAAALEKVEEVVLTTRKPPRGLKGAPYVEEKGLDLDSLKKDTVIFEGTALEAVKAFPKNINVSAALSMAGIGAKDTKVRIVCVPKSETNSHQIELRGASGTISVKTENLPSPGNPKTSYLAVLSAKAVLRGIVDGVRIGT